MLGSVVVRGPRTDRIGNCEAFGFAALDGVDGDLEEDEDDVQVREQIVHVGAEQLDRPRLSKVRN